MQDEARPRLRCYLSVPFSPEFQPVSEALTRAVREGGGTAIRLDQQAALFPGLRESVQGEIARADCLVADLTGRRDNVFFELGLAQAMGKGVFLCARIDEKETVPVELQGAQIYFYEPSRRGLVELSAAVAGMVRDYRRSPRRGRIGLGQRIATPFFVDWDLLGPSEAENLCRELLAQMGYQRLDWAKSVPNFELVAELPRKDPDGFEYRELWLVSIRRREPMAMILDLAEGSSELLLHRLLSEDSPLAGRLASRSTGPVPMTLLFIVLDEESLPEHLMRRRLGLSGLRLGRHAEQYGTSPRIRFWDRNYLTSLVQQFPQVGYKYFSDEGRARSKYRKTPEELYRENVSLGADQAKLIQDLEDERNKRVRAERDSVWKDISFSAAHKIGNPIFAIETDLDPLKRRVAENRIEEASEVIQNIQASVEKAKAIIDQFKSLTRAQ
jgi:hypothetical protein